MARREGPSHLLLPSGGSARGPYLGHDDEGIEAFRNFLSWGEQPADAGGERRMVPPGWWAYVFGLTTWCPPIGEW